MSLGSPGHGVDCAPRKVTIPYSFAGYSPLPLLGVYLLINDC